MLSTTGYGCIEIIIDAHKSQAQNVNYSITITFTATQMYHIVGLLFYVCARIKAMSRYNIRRRRSWRWSCSHDVHGVSNVYRTPQDFSYPF